MDRQAGVESSSRNQTAPAVVSRISSHSPDPGDAPISMRLDEQQPTSTNRLLSSSNKSTLDLSSATLQLKTSDGYQFSINLSAAFQSRVLRDMYEVMMRRGGTKVEQKSGNRSFLLDPESNVIDLGDQIRGSTLARIIEYCNHHQDDDRFDCEVNPTLAQATASLEESELDRNSGAIGGSEASIVPSNPPSMLAEEEFGPQCFEAFPQWDRDFINPLSPKALVELVRAANYLDVIGLLNLGCIKLAQIISGKTIEQVREMFGIRNDFSGDEEEQIREINRWLELN